MAKLLLNVMGDMDSINAKRRTFSDTLRKEDREFKK